MQIWNACFKFITKTNTTSRDAKYLLPWNIGWYEPPKCVIYKEHDIKSKLIN